MTGDLQDSYYILGGVLHPCCSFLRFLVLSLFASWWRPVSDFPVDLPPGITIVGKRLSKAQAQELPSGSYKHTYKNRKYMEIHLLGGGFKYFLFSPILGEDEPILTNIFQLGWKHQLVYRWIQCMLFSIGQILFVKNGCKECYSRLPETRQKHQSRLWGSNLLESTEVLWFRSTCCKSDQFLLKKTPIWHSSFPACVYDTY